jgi:hypothetical protein
LIINERLDKLEQVNTEQLQKKDAKSNVGKRWTPEQEECMLNEIAENTSIVKIAEMIKRTYGGITSRLLIIARKMIQEQDKTYEEASRATSLSIDYIKTGKLYFQAI